MAERVKAIPDGLHSITPNLIIKDASKAIDWYKKALGAQELYRMPGPDGRLMHAEIKIGDAVVMMTDEMPEMGGRGPQMLGGTPVSLTIYCEDCDALFNRAVGAGASVRMPLEDAFWGDRWGMLTDPFGHVWSIATRKENLSVPEMKRAMEEFMANFKAPQAPESMRRS
jgi:PhnB protein